VKFATSLMGVRMRDYAEVARCVEAGGFDSIWAPAWGGARPLYKLMAYKDEYEVARLRLGTHTSVLVRQVAGDRDVKVAFNLHPPVLRSMGLDRKLRLGPSSRPLLRVLERAQRLRGTTIDPFGRTKMRQLERALVDEYIVTIERVASGLTAHNHATAVAIAALPDMVRGYESVKEGNVERYGAEVARLLEEFADAATDPPVAP
jgi:indolepyruvate ferredoxin oxidoreductase